MIAALIKLKGHGFFTSTEDIVCTLCAFAMLSEHFKDPGYIRISDEFHAVLD